MFEAKKTCFVVSLSFLFKIIDLFVGHVVHGTNVHKTRIFVIEVPFDNEQICKNCLPKH